MRDLNVLETEFVLLSSTAGQTVLAQGLSGTRAFGWHTLTLTIKVSSQIYLFCWLHTLMITFGYWLLTWAPTPAILLNLSGRNGINLTGTISSSSFQGQYATGLLNGYPLWKNAVVLGPKNGWAAIGTKSFELAQFDNFAVTAEWRIEGIEAALWLCLNLLTS